jgi:hypothetical protein
MDPRRTVLYYNNMEKRRDLIRKITGRNQLEKVLERLQLKDMGSKKAALPYAQAQGPMPMRARPGLPPPIHGGRPMQIRQLPPPPPGSQRMPPPPPPINRPPRR